AKLSDYIGKRVDLPDTQTAVQAPVTADTLSQIDGTSGVQSPGNAIEPAIETVKSIIAEQTGYTSDMLEDDLDLEADLGIDTVKQVEIFAKIASHFNFSVPDDLKLRDLNTIAKLSEYVNTNLIAMRSKDKSNEHQPEQKPVMGTSEVQQINEAEQKEATAVPSAATDNDFPDPASPIKRLIVRTKESDPLPLSKKDFTGKTIIVSLDNHGFAKAVIKKIKDKKGKVITIGAKGADFKFDLTNVKAVEKQVEEFKKAHPDVNGFIHLAPLDFYFNQKKVKDNFDDSLNTTIKSFFVMIKSLFETFDQPASVIGTITFDSVVFPYMEGGNEIFPMFAGLSGLLKTANKELKNTQVKVVDFSYKQPKKSLAKITTTFINELLSDDTRCEVGYKNNKRYVLAMKPSIADKSQQIITSGDTMLVTGGAGGITYEIIKKVVEKYKINLIILDINDIYSTDSKYLDKSSTDPQLMAMLKEDMPGVKPIEIKRALDRLTRVRQSVENIEYLESLGISVEYNCVDVTNAKAVKAAVDKYEKIDGIFHAAGMEMSQFIAKKELW
ncbi:MAG: KR domain-containing protein, partial [Desulfobacula sp.]|nr:KR domain-containing protein [Desulfobacula sp.]